MVKITNLNLSLRHDLKGVRPDDYMKSLGIKYVLGLSQSVFDAVWFLGCSNVPKILPASLTRIKGGYGEYLQYIDKNHNLFIEQMEESGVKFSKECK